MDINKDGRITAEEIKKFSHKHFIHLDDKVKYKLYQYFFSSLFTIKYAIIISSQIIHIKINYIS